jgi:hypothetical protein
MKTQNKHQRPNGPTIHPYPMSNGRAFGPQQNLLTMFLGRWPRLSERMGRWPELQKFLEQKCFKALPEPAGELVIMIPFPGPF